MTSARTAAALLLLVLASAPVAGAPADPERARRLADLERVGQLVRENFFDATLAGIDWDEALARAREQVSAARSREEAAEHVNDLLARLGTSHTHYYTDDDPAYYFLLDLFREAPVGEVIGRRFPGEDVGYVGIGVFTRRVGGASFVRAVVDGGPAEAAGVLPGDRLVTVEGQPWHPIRPFRGRAGQPTRLVVQRSPDSASSRELVVTPQVIRPVDFYLAALRASARTFTQDGVEIAYIRVWSYAGEQNQRAIEELLGEPPLADADALVLDLRDGWGGANPDYLDLFNARIPVLATRLRSGETVTFDRRWRKPVALLVDETTRSGKEVLAWAFRHHGYGPVVGARTAGAVAAGRLYPVGDAALLYLAVGEVRVDGELLEGRGVVPDRVVPRPLPYSAGVDPQREAAIEMMAAPAAHPEQVR
jgi:carboxyl-terminal processing protease